MINSEKRNRQGLTEKEFLAAYNPGKYERPSVTVDMLIFTVTNEEKKNYRTLPKKELKLLMIKRGDHPCIGQWALPGGFVEMNESLEQAAVRELKEETSIDNVYMEQLYTWGDVARDPRTRIISTSYMALVDSNSLNVMADDDADDAKWFSVEYKVFQEQKTLTKDGYELQRLYKLTLCDDEEENKLEAVIKKIKVVKGRTSRVYTELKECSGIAFDHAQIIGYAIERLRTKIEYTDIAFNLMPELFTLTELQQVYEIILDTDLLKANFRRKTAHMVLETNDFTKDAGHRPSKLYRFNTDWQKINS
jgi:ADP-ribose pyrophosphatase YjhB (NUDIX family)